mgnify:CR=1 FL=1
MDEQNKQQIKKQASIIQEKTTETNGKVVKSEKTIKSGKTETNGKNVKRKKNAKVLTTIAIVIIIATIGILVWRRNIDTEQNNENDYMLKIETPYLSGQGVLYSCKEENAYILTAGHMMLGMNIGAECDVTYGVSGDTKKATLLYLSENADIAILQAAKDDFKGAKQAAFEVSRYDALKEGDAVSFLCYEEGADVSVTEGTVTDTWIYLDDFSINMMLVEAETHSGMSGCGVYDAEGYLVGILCGSSEDGTEAAILPLSIIRSEIIQAGL